MLNCPVSIVPRRLMTPVQIDPRAARGSFERAAARGVEASALARETARRMFGRLDYVRLSPRKVLDVGCGSGEDFALLRRRYPGALFIGADLAFGMAQGARGGRSLLSRARRWFGPVREQYLCADMARLPLAGSSFDLLWSNLALAWVSNPLDSFCEFHRVLAPGGLLMFSTYGPDTLKELRDAFSGVDGYPHVHEFIDMHDLGDMLVAAGFGSPVMDMEMVTLTYSDVRALARELQRTGQTNALPDRRRGMMGRGAWARMCAAYERLRRDGQIPATVELVFGHAWKPEARAARDQGVPIRFMSRSTPER